MLTQRQLGQLEKEASIVIYRMSIFDFSQKVRTLSIKIRQEDSE